MRPQEKMDILSQNDNSSVEFKESVISREMVILQPEQKWLVDL